MNPISAVIVGDNEEPINVDLAPPPLKKYRLQFEIYDEYDQKYATHMKSLPVEYNRQPFDDFTDHLLDETYISRFKLLDAIRDYNASGIGETYPLGDTFENAAYNYRPHQPCTIS
jgi:hypothetical protein